MYLSPFYLYNTVSPKIVYSVYPAALFGAISAVFSGKHPAINKGRKRYIYFQEKIHNFSRRESFIRIIPYISPPRYVYLVLCKKDSGLCARLKPTYVGICGEGESSSFTHRLGGHLGTATQTCQENTVKPVGRHFRLPGHDPHRDLVMLPIGIVSARDPFLLRWRERFNIWKI